MQALPGNLKVGAPIRARHLAPVFEHGARESGFPLASRTVTQTAIIAPLEWAAETVDMARVLLLIPTTSYRAADFLAAATRLGIEVAIGSNHRQALDKVNAGLTLDFTDTQGSVRAIEAFAMDFPLEAIVPSDDESTILAAEASRVLGLSHNPPKSVAATRDKYRQRTSWRTAGLPTPTFRRFQRGEDIVATAQAVTYPCVIKPLSMSASRGVMRADDAKEFTEACARIAKIIDGNPDGVTANGDMLVEDYIPGSEVALEGLLINGGLRVLALFDKPDPLVGPAFEETLYVTPSRLPDHVQQAVFDATERGLSVLDLQEGPIHTELRVNDRGVWLIEVAARSIGGLCARTLRFGAGVSLEELVLRHALGQSINGLCREDRAAGVMMLPIPRPGTLRRVDGVLEARGVAGVEDVKISIPLGQEVLPPPEGGRYLGFIFARADSPAAVEMALRNAHARLTFDIAPPGQDRHLDE